MLLFKRNLINNKLNILYIRAFKIKEIREVTILLKLSNIKIYSRFYIFLLKKVLYDILKVIS